MFDRFSWTRDKIEELTKNNPRALIVDIGCNECPVTREMTNCTWVDCESYETIANIIKERQVLLYTKDPAIDRFLTTSWKTKETPPIPREKFVQADAESLPFADKQFDVAIATQLLAYLANPVAGLKEIKRIAKQAIITVRNEKDWDPKYRTSQPTSMRFYTEDMLRLHLNEAGIDDYSFERLDYNGWSFFAVVIGNKIRARFIGGIGGCGGMMLARWLDLHPNVHSFGETGLVANNWLYYLHLEQIEKTLISSKRQVFSGSLVYNADEWQLLKESLSELANSCDDALRDRRRIGDFIDKLFIGLAQLNNKKIWVEKTPMNIFLGDRLMEYFGNEFRIVWIEREPRDNICCIAFTKSWEPNDLFGAINYWATSTKRALQSISTIPERLYMRVSYEDFVYNQVAVGKEICEFLQIPWHKNLEVPITTDADIGRYKEEFRLAVSTKQEEYVEQSPFTELEATALSMLIVRTHGILRENPQIANIGSSQLEASTLVCAKAILPYHGNVFVINNWTESNLCIFKQRMVENELSELVHPLNMDSEAASKKFNDQTFDSIFIDRGNNYKMRQDIDYWLPKVRPGGLMCGKIRNEGILLTLDECFGRDYYLISAPSTTGTPSMWYVNLASKRDYLMNAHPEGFGPQHEWNKEMAMKLLLDMRGIFNAKGIKFWLCFGTFIGVYRDGGFTSSDKDIDLAVYSEDMERIGSCADLFAEKGIEFVPEPDPTLYRDAQHIDFHPFRRSGDKRIWGKYEIDVSDFETPNWVEFWGEKWRIFSHPEKWLEHIYGSDWRTPKENIHAHAEGTY